MSSLDTRETTIGLVVALGGLVAVLDTTIVVVALPELIIAFGSSITDVQWVSTAYSLALVGTMPLAAVLADRWGSRRVYVTALAGFAAASVWAGLASGLGALVAARAAQGLAGGLITPLGMAIAFGAVAPERRGRMIALTGLPLLIGPILGPVLGGVLIDAGSWRSIFFVTVVPALLGAVGALRWVPSTGRAQQPPRTDLRGGLLLVPGVVLAAYGMAAEGTSATVRLATAGVGVVLVAWFVRRSLTRPEPLLRVRLLGDSTFGRNAAVLGSYAAPYFGSMLLIPTYVQVLRADSALDAATLMIPGAVAMGISIQVAARVLERLGARLVVGTGLGLAIAQGLVGVIILSPDTPYLVLAVLGAVQGLGTGAVMMPTMATATRNLHGPDLASGSAILPLVSTLANGLGTVAVSALFSAFVAWRTSGTTLAMLDGLDPTSRVAAVADAVDGLRLTWAVTLVVMLLALGLRLRGSGVSTPVRESAEGLAGERN